MFSALPSNSDIAQCDRHFALVPEEVSAPPHGQRVTSAARCPYASSLLLDALDPDRTEAGVFAADVCFKLLLFVFECLDRVDIGKL
jgi:hypothetical protein